MSSKLATPVLTLDAGKMHQVDPRNVESLFGMWTMFHKCSRSIKDGSRLENLSWRAWSHELLCCPPQPERTIVPAMDVPTGRSSEVPSLSNSVTSEDSSREETSSLAETTPRSSFHGDPDSALSKSRGNESHLTPTTLKKIVTTIQEKSEFGPLSPSLEASLPAMSIATTKEPETNDSTDGGEDEAQSGPLRSSTDSCLTAATTNTSSTTARDHRSSDTSVSSDGLIRSGSVVHGFSPVSASFRMRSGHLQPTPSSKLIPRPTKPGMFTLGGSSEDEDSSFDSRVMSLKPVLQRSSLSQSLSQQSLKRGLQQKVTSFKDIVEQRRIHEDAENDEGAIESSDEEDDDDIVDSAIEDDDDGEWEDSNSDDGKPAVQEPTMFKRVESRPNLVSRRSMLTTKLNEQDRESALISQATRHQASRSSPALRRSPPSSPKGPSIPGGSPDEHDEEGGLMMQGPRSRPMPIIVTTSNTHPTAHSPRTTRRNMLSTELTESLRKNLLWERQQKSQTVNAFLKRNRNAQSMANLQTHGAAGPSQPGPSERDTSKNNSWNHYFDNPWEYHAKGW